MIPTSGKIMSFETVELDYVNFGYTEADLDKEIVLSKNLPLYDIAVK